MFDAANPQKFCTSKIWRYTVTWHAAHLSTCSHMLLTWHDMKSSPPLYMQSHAPHMTWHMTCSPPLYMQPVVGPSQSVHLTDRFLERSALPQLPHVPSGYLYVSMPTKSWELTLDSIECITYCAYPRIHCNICPKIFPLILKPFLGSFQSLGKLLFCGFDHFTA